jgi:hypothetical protein
MPWREFRLLDAMILVAATASGCGVMKWLNRGALRDLYAQCWDLLREGPGDNLAAVGQSILILADLMMPLVAMVMLAFIAMRLLGPRPPFRRLARQPGIVAACASCLASVLIGLPVIFVALVAGWDDVSEWFVAEEQVMLVTMCGGLAVLVSWVTLLLSRRWRAERSWVDRLGRAIGVFWIMAALPVATADVFSQSDLLRSTREVSQKARIRAVESIAPKT